MTDSRFFVNLNINKLLLMTTAVAFTAAALISAAAYLAAHPSLPPALFAAMTAGIVALYFLAKDVEKIVSEGVKKNFQLRFIFRLACFAILLYLLLVRFKLNPLGVVIGLPLPTLSMAAVLLYTTLRKQR